MSTSNVVLDGACMKDYSKILSFPDNSRIRQKKLYTHTKI